MYSATSLDQSKYGLTQGKFHKTALEFFDESAENYENLKDLLNDFNDFHRSLPVTSAYFDVIIRSTNAKEDVLTTNSTIFAARSNTFDDLYRASDMQKYRGFKKEYENGKCIITIPDDYSLDTFDLILHYVFVGYLDLHEADASEDIYRELFVLSSFFDLKQLRRSMSTKLASYFTYSNAIDYLNLAKEHECKLLKRFIFEFIMKFKLEIINFDKSKWNKYFAVNPNLLEEIFQSAATKSSNNSRTASSLI